MVEIVRRLYDEVNVHNMLSSQGFVDNGDQIDLFVKTSRILININTLNKTCNSLYPIHYTKPWWHILWLMLQELLISKYDVLVMFLVKLCLFVSDHRV